MDLFRDKIAFVTGGGSGLGRSLCEELASRGSICVAADINKEAACRVAEGIVAAGGLSYAVEVDVTQPVALKESIDGVVRQFGRLDFVFNNAGTIIMGEVRDMEWEHWHRIIELNLLGVIYGTAAAYAQMLTQGNGHIVNIASVGGLIPMPTYAAYSATKHAVVGLSTSLRAEASSLGIKVSVVCPGTMNTGMGAAATILNASRELLESRSRKRKALDPTAAARQILRGLERNKRFIVFPFSARLLWCVHRIHPAFLAPLESWLVKAIRAARTDKSTKVHAG